MVKETVVTPPIICMLVEEFRPMKREKTAKLGSEGSASTRFVPLTSTSSVNWPLSGTRDGETEAAAWT
jgi:hypothetical protein